MATSVFLSDLHLVYYSNIAEPGRAFSDFRGTVKSVIFEEQNAIFGERDFGGKTGDFRGTKRHFRGTKCDFRKRIQ